MRDIGGNEIKCFVLDDGRRVLSGRSLTSAIGMKGRGQGVARISTNKLIKSSNNRDLSVAIEEPIKFVGKSPKGRDELSSEDGVPASELIQSLSGGTPHLQGTWVHPRVAIHLALE